MQKLKKLFVISSIFLNLILAVFVVKFLFSPLHEDQVDKPSNQEAVLSESSTQKEGVREEKILEGASEAVVTKVIDGDTVAIEGGEVIRYIGIDTPETNDCYGKEASARNSELVLGKKVVLEKDVSERDRYQRLLRYVWLDGELVNEILVREGYAKASSYPPDVKYQERFREAERQAREVNRGLWSGCSEVKTPPGDSAQPPVSGNWNCSTNTYNCGDFKTQAEAQSAFEACGGSANDVHKLDRDNDGRVCETLP